MAIPLGAQLYIFRDKFALEKDMATILPALADAGYAGIEGFLEGQPDIRVLLDANNLRYFGAHLTLAELTDVSAAAAYVQRMGGADLCSSGPLVWHDRTADDYRRTAAVLNEKGRLLREQGIHLHYHNHDFEFAKVDGEQTGMELLLAELDFSVVTFCLDVGWLWLARTDPVAFLKEHAAKIGYLHLRDFKGQISVALGNGDMELAPILETLPVLRNLRHIVVEQDPYAPDPLASMRQSRAYLRHYHAANRS